jgi:hypothetical protein
MPPDLVVARMFAPADSNICASAASPLAAAQCSAVMPSPCAPFTSAPLLSSALTAAASRALAASATSAPGSGLQRDGDREQSRQSQHLRLIRNPRSDPLRISRLHRIQSSGLVLSPN